MTHGNTIDPIFSNPRLAVLYDAFDGDRSDLPPYVEIIKGLHANKIVDLGCGTGVLALLLAEKDLHVIAVDPAEASIDVARSKPGANKVEWIVGDANSLSGVTVDAVVMTGNVAQAITKPDQWKLTLRHIRSALKPGGHLIFETRKPHAEVWKQWNRKDSFQSILVPGVGLVDGWVELTKLDLPLVSFRWTYFFHEDNTTLTSDSTLRFRSLEEIAKDLNDHGFKIKEVREAPDRPDKEYVVIAQSTKS